MDDSKLGSWRWGAFVATLLVALGLQVPSLRTGFFADDFLLRQGLASGEGLAPLRAWSLYDFGRRSDWEAFGEAHGGLPWWTGETWKVRFFRPLASLSLALDERLFGAWSPGWHATSLLLYALLLFLAWRWFEALGLPARTAIAALALFALADATVLPVGWIANRNSLCEALFAVGAAVLLAPGARARTAARPLTKSRLLLAAALALAAALSKESGLAAFAWIAFVCHARGLRVARNLAVLAIPLGLGALALAGFGTASEFYATPWNEPGRCAANAAVLGTVGSLSLLGPLPLDLVALSPLGRAPFVLAGALLGLPLWAWIARTLARSPQASTARDLAVWTALFLLPQAAATPSERLLFVAALGAAGISALFFVEIFTRPRGAGLGLGARGLAALCLLAATLGSGGILVAQVRMQRSFAEHVRALARGAETGPRGQGRREAFVMQTEGSLVGFAIAGTFLGLELDPNVRFQIVHPGARALRWTRTGDATFELESLEEPFLTTPFERVYLAPGELPEPARPMRSGPLEVTVDGIEPGRGVRRLHVRLPRSLDDPGYVFLRSEGAVLRRVEPPRVGASVEWPRAVPTFSSMP